MINNYDSVETCYSTGSTSSLKQEDNSYTAKKRTWLSFITLFVALMSFVFVQGQSTANYAFSTSTIGSLAADANGNAIDMSVGATSLVATGVDSGASAVTNIGFNFTFMSTIYSQFSASSNGVMQLGSTAVSTTTTTSSGGTTAAPKFSALGSDAITASLADGGGVTSKVVGTAPNRCLIVQWVSYSYWSNTASPATFQVRLYETSGVVEYVYGAMPVGAGAAFSYATGFSVGTLANQLACITTSTNTLSTSTFTTNTYSAGTNIANLHSTANGSRTTYKFTPPVPASGPSNLILSNATTNTMTLDWTAAADVTNVVRYIVLNSINGGTTYNFVANVAVGTNTYAATGLIPGTTYNWKVVAVSEGVEATPALGTQATLNGATYYWTGASNDTFATLGKWNTAADGTGTAPTAFATTDVYVIDGDGTTAGGSTIINVSAAVSVGQLKITNNTAVTFQASTTTKLITVTGGPGDDFVIESGSTLNLNHATLAVGIAFSGTGNTGLISGTYNAAGSTSNVITTTGGTGTLVTVAATGVVNNAILGSSGCLLGSAATLSFVNGSSYTHSSFTTTNGFIPLATWGASSNVTITGGTTATAITNPAQTFGNFTYNSATSTGTMSVFTTGTTAVIQGNLTIAATNTGKFRALTSGTLTVNGNLNVTGGTFEVASTTGTINVLGNVSISGGVFDVAQGGASNLKVKGNFVQTGGSLQQTSTTGTLEFNGVASQTFTPATVTAANFLNLKVNNAAGVVLTANLPVKNVTVSLGNITGAGLLAYNSTASVLTYNGAVAQTATTTEFPSANAPLSLTINNTATAPNNVVSMPFNAALAGTTGGLTLTAGILDNSSYTITVPNTAAGSVSAGSATAYIKGALERVLPASLVTGSTYSFPVGKSAFNPFALVNPITNAGGSVNVKAEVVDAPTGGTSGTLMGALNTNRYWAASITSGAANFTESLVRLSDAPNGADAIANSATLTGAYNLLGGLTVTSTASSLTSTAPGATSINGFYVMGAKAAATLATPAITPSGNQCTNVSRAISVLITPGGGTISTVVLNYNINGVAQTAINMTNSTNNGGMAADTWIATIPTVTPTNATVTWSVTATDANSLSRSITGATYTDELNLGVITTATASSATTCAGDSTTLSIGVNRVANGVQGAGALTGASTGNTIFPGSWGGAKSQYLIKASELSALGLIAGNITSIGFEPTTSGQTYQGFQLWANLTTDTALNGTFLANGTRVYLATGTDNGYVPTANAVNTLAFGTGAGSASSFYWDGVSNVVLTFSWSSVPSASTSTSSSMKYDTISYNACIYKQADSQTPAAMLAYTTGTTSTSRPRFTFNTNSAPTPTSYSWSDGTTVVGTTSTLTVNPTVTTTYTVTAIGNNCPLTASTTVTVNPLPTAPTTTASTQCGAGVPPATAADPNGFTAPTYKWYAAATGGSSLYSSTNTTYGLPVSASTTLYVSVVNPTTNCESARTAVAITVNTADVLGISGAPTTSVCLGQTFQLTPTQTGSNGNVFALTWAASTAGSGLTATTAATLGQAVTVTPTAAGTYTYSINGSEASSGCTGAATSASITVVNPNDGVSATASASSPTICSGSVTSLSLDISSSNAAPTTYCTVNAATSSSSYFDSFTTTGAITNITNSGSGFATAGYGNYTNLVAKVNPGQTFNFNTSLIGTTVGVSIWADWNRNGTFETTEKVYGTTGYVSTASGAITVPAGTAYGYTRMRIMLDWNNSAPSNPCSIGTRAEVEDYSFLVVPTPTAYSWSNGSTVVGTTNPLVVNPVNTTIYAGTATINGCPVTASTTVTTNPLPTALTAFNSNQCGLGVPAASVADNNGYTNPTINWYAAATGGTALQSSTATTYLTAINTTTTFYVSVADPVTGCESPRTAVTVSVIVPDVISATATPSTICLGQSIALASANTATTPTQNYTYSWSSTTGSGLETPQSGATATVTPTAAGTYTYTITGIDGICTQINTVAVTVNPVPAITTATVDPTVACAGSTINLGASITSIAAGTSPASGTGTTYSSSFGYPTFFGNYWYQDWTQMVYTAAELQAMGLTAGNITSIRFNIGGLPDATTISNYSISLGSTANDVLTGFQTTGLTTVYGPVTHTVPTATGNVTINFTTPYAWDGVSNILVDVRGTGAYGSANSTTQYSATTGNTVVYGYSSSNNAGFYTSSPTANTSTNRPNLRFGGQLLTNTTSNYNWSWTAGSTSVLTTASGTTILPATTTTYTVTATNPTTGCSASQNFTVTANPLPLAPVATNSVQCGVQQPTASVTDPNNFSYPYINWYASANATTPLQSSISNTFSNTISATTTFYVSVVNPATNCESPRTAVLATVNMPDSISAISSNAAICLGQSITLTSGNTATTPTQNYVYSWSSTTDSGLENPVAGVSTSATPTAAGSYVYTVTGSDALTTCVITNTVTVTVNPVPVITTATANPSIACAGSTIALEATLLGIAPGISENTGTGTTYTTATGYPTFFGNYWYQDWSQMVYTAAELQAKGLRAGNITSLTFNISTLPDTAVVNDYAIRLGSTSNNTLTGFETTSLTTVYGPTAHAVSSTGDITINFTTPYAWDGVSNIIVDVRGSGQYGSANARTQYTATTGNTVVYGYSFSNNPAFWTSNPTATTSTSRPNLTFGGQIESNIAFNYNWNWSIGSTTVLTSLAGNTTLPAGATTTYTVTATNPTTGCSSSQNVLVSTNISPLAVASVTTTSSSICIGSSTTLSAAPTGGCIPYTYSWSNGTSVVGTSATLTVSPTTTTTYTLTVTDNAGTIVTVPSLITVNNPQPTSVAGQTICANSAAFTLTASPSSTSNSVNWFASPTSTAVLSTSSSFTTPVLTAPSTTYYVEERANDPELSGNGLGTSTVPNLTGASSQRGIVFTATKPFKLVSAQYYSAGTNVSNTVSISLVDDSSGTTVASTSVTVPQGATAGWNTMNINFDVLPGTYRLLASYSTSVYRASTGFTYPYTLGTSGSITSGYNFGIDSASYNYFHNITIQEFCAGTRVPVTATLNAPPALAISGASTTICEADSTATVSVTTGATDYDQYSWSPATGVTSGTNGWTFNPTTTTAYTLTASQSAGTCSNTAAYVVNVNPLPTAITITPAAPSICVGDTQMLTAAGGNYAQSAFGQTMEFLPSEFVVSAGATAAIDNTYYAQGFGSILFTTPSTFANETYQMNQDVNLNGAASATVTFSHIASMEGSFTSYDYGYVEYSADGGNTWVTFSPTNYVGSASTGVFNGNARFTTRSYPDWISTFTGSTSTPGAGPATSLWKTESFNVPAAALTSQFRIRFRYTTDSSTNYYGWLIDNVKIVKTQGNISWSPATNLYTNAAATIPYVAGANAATVYVKSAQAGSQTYTATSVSTLGCVRTATVPVIVNALPTVVTNAVSVCAPATVDLTAASVTAGSSTDITTLTYWTDAAATVALANPSAVAVSGTYYIVASNANGCSSTITPVTVTVNPLPVLTITNPATACFPATVDLTAAAVTAGSSATGMTLSYFTDAAATTALATPAAVTTSGTYYIKITNNATGCYVISPVVVTIDVTSAPTGSATQTFCGAANLSQLSVTGSNIRWYSAATGGVEYPASIWTAVGLVNGTTYYASQTVNGCESAPRIAVTVTINAIPSAPNASAQSFCGSATVADLVPSGSSLTWYSVATAGSALTSTTALASGTYYVSQTSNGCEGPRTAVAVTVNGTALPTASAQTFCGPVTVASLVASGTSINWYNVATGGAALAGSTSLSTGTYYVTQTLNGCESPRLSVAVTVNTVAAPTGAAVQDACTGTIADFVVTGDTGAVLTWYATSTSTTSIPTSTPAVLNTFYYVSQTVNGCEGPRLVVIASGPCLGNEEFDMTSFSYYPNPTRDIVNISYSKEITEIKVFNMLGQQVIDTKVNSTTTQVDLSRFATGTYFIEVTSDEVSKTVKVIKN
jgi:hypothetical protein